MKINLLSWEKHQLSDYFDIRAGKYYYSGEYSVGSTPYITATVMNNGVSEYIDLPPDFEGNCITTEKISCTAFYQKNDFCATSDINIFTPNFDGFNEHIGLFIASIINFDQNYRWSYGRQCRVGDSKKIEVYLPTSINGSPDWAYMEKFIKNLKYKKITTTNSSNNRRLQQKSNLELWKEFYLHDLFTATMGNGINAVDTTSNAPLYNYVTRTSNNNGVVDFVDEIQGQEPFPKGAITLALGGSLGSAFIQQKPFYTGQNVGVLIEKEPLSDATKLFITTLIKNEAKTKFHPFGRELNAHFRRSFTLKLPIKRIDGEPFIDETKQYSEQGYVPDWGFMHDYITSLPYGDRIPNRLS